MIHNTVIFHLYASNFIERESSIEKQQNCITVFGYTIHIHSVFDMILVSRCEHCKA